MRKRIGCILLLAVLALCLVACNRSANNDDSAEGFLYEIENDSVTIVGYAGLESNVTVPDTIDGYPVTVIAENAFRGMTGLTDITLPDSVTTIDYAFVECQDLVNVTLGSGITSMNGAFRDCTALTAVNGGENAVAMDETFLRCSALSEGVIPSTARSCQSTFRGCTSLSSVTIEEGVQVLNLTFDGCSDLRSVTIPASVTLTYATFRDCSSLTEVSGGDNITVLDMTFKNCSRLTSLALGDAVTQMSDAFTDCSSLKTISGLPTEVETYTASFNGCKAITALVIPAITSEESLAAYDLSGDFENCAALKEIVIYPTLSLREEFCKLFAGCLSLQTVTMPDAMMTALLRVDASYTDTLFTGENKTVTNAVNKYRKASSVRLTDNYGKIDGVSYTHIYGGDIDVVDVEDAIAAAEIVGFTPFTRTSYWCGYPMGGNRLTETVAIQRTYTFFLRVTGKNDGTLPTDLTVNGLTCRAEG